MDSTEEWKEIVPGTYWLNRSGKVFNGSRILKPWIHNGYYELTLQINGKKKHFPIHKLIGDNFIPNPESKRCLDHINGDRLDNRIENLRWATNSENMWNRKTTFSESGYKGVSLTNCGKYRALITCHKKTHYLGIYKTAKEAHEAYCEAAKKLHGEFHNPGPTKV
jgi:hypothetical protein